MSNHQPSHTRKAIIAGVTTICVTLAPLLSARSTDDTLADIDDAIAEARWDDAAATITALLQADPSNPMNPMLLSNLGMVRFYAGSDSLALDALNDASRMAPSSVSIQANRARVLLALGHADEAIALYDYIEQLDSTYSDTYLYRGMTRLYAGDFDSALADLMRLRELAPAGEDTNVAFAAYYTLTDSPEQALPYFNTLIRSIPTAEYYSGRAMALLRLNRLADAADDIAEGLRLDPQNGELYLCRALLNSRRYCREEALADSRRAISLGVDPARVAALMN